MTTQSTSHGPSRAGDQLADSVADVVAAHAGILGQWTVHFRSGSAISDTKVWDFLACHGDQVAVRDLVTDTEATPPSDSTSRSQHSSESPPVPLGGVRLPAA